MYECETFGFISWHLLRLPLATSQRLASLLLLMMLMVMMLVVLLRLVMLMLVVLMVVVAIICWGWTVDNSQARTAVVHSVDGEGAAAVFVVSLVSMVSMVSMGKLSRVAVD